MSRSQFDCARCGASITVFGRNRAESERTAKFRAQRGDVCADCEADDRAQEAHAAAEAAAAAGLPEITGTEKQRAWAETIRAQVMKRLELAAPLVGRHHPAQPGAGRSWGAAHDRHCRQPYPFWVDRY